MWKHIFSFSTRGPTAADSASARSKDVQQFESSSVRSQYSPPDGQHYFCPLQNRIGKDSKRGILSKSIRLLLFLIEICGLRKARCSVADWSYCTDKRICTVWKWEKCSKFFRCNEDVNFIREISALLIYHGWLGSLETWIRLRKRWDLAEIFAMQRDSDWSYWPAVESLVQNWLLCLAQRGNIGLCRLSRASRRS